MSGSLQVRFIPGKGRGVFATAPIPSRTVVDSSQCMLFTDANYNEHAKYTPLVEYVFRWRHGGGEWALALGTGSMFNHARVPNVGWVGRGGDCPCLEYVTLRDIQVGEELCICYGRNLWFETDDTSSSSSSDEGSHPLPVGVVEEEQ